MATELIRGVNHFHSLLDKSIKLEISLNPPFHWTAISLRSWRSQIFSKTIPNRRRSIANHTIWGHDAYSTLPLRFYYASTTLLLHFCYDPTTTMKIQLRLVYADGDAAGHYEPKYLFCWMIEGPGKPEWDAKRSWFHP